MDDFYDLLEVPENASTAEIDQAWREKARTYHPDRNDDARANAQFKTLKKAHEVLSDETERAAYDRLGHATYVRKRLDGLPTMDPPRPTDRVSEDASGPSAGDGATTGASSSSATGGSASSDSARSDERDTWRTSGASTTSGTTRGRGDHTAETTARTRRPLWYGWAGVFLAGVLYLAGLERYLRANAAAVADLRAAVVADPVAGLTATSGLLPPGTFVLETATVAAPLSLLFPAGIGVLAVAFVAVVAAFGRGSAYLYLLAGIAPLAGLAVGPAVSLPDGAVLALVVLCPIGATVVFLADVGRVLLGSS